MDNKKNKPITIFKIYLLVQKHTIVQLIEFDVPLILKPLESTQITLEPITSYSNLDLADEAHFDLYLFTNQKEVKCEPINFNDYAFRSKYKGVRTVRKIFNGIPYANFHKYAVVIGNEPDEIILFIGENGSIFEMQNQAFLSIISINAGPLVPGVIKEEIANNSPYSKEQISVIPLH